MPARTSAWSSASTTRIIGPDPPRGRSRGNVASKTVPCPGCRAQLDRAAGDGDALLHAGQSQAAAGVRAAPARVSGSKPPPSSRTESARRSPAVNRRSQRLRARAWRSTLVIASWATRKQAVSMSGRELRRRLAGVEVRREAAEARLPVEVRAQRRHQAEVVELQRPQVERELAHALERVARRLDAFLDALAAARRRPACASDSSWIFSAVSAWPMSSCRSRARLRRSSSCTSSSRCDSARSRVWMRWRSVTSFSSTRRASRPRQRTRWPTLSTSSGSPLFLQVVEQAALHRARLAPQELAERLALAAAAAGPRPSCRGTRRGCSRRGAPPRR